MSPAALIAIGIGGTDAVRSGPFLLALRPRGLHWVEFVLAAEHAGLRSTVHEVLAFARAELASVGAS